MADRDDLGEVASGRVLWHVTMSLDGFIAGPDHAMDWIFEYAEPNPVVDDVIELIGAILAGRGTYDVGKRVDQVEPATEAYGGAWAGPQFVLTHNPPPEGEEPTITFLNTNVRDAVGTALAAAKGKDVVVFGANVARQCVDEGLVDDVVVHLAPILLGDGVPMFTRPGGVRLRLDPVSVSRAGQITNLRFQVRR